MAEATQDWYPDPLGRFELRYWDGSKWTEHVSTGGVADIDPVDLVSQKESADSDVPAHTEPGVDGNLDAILSAVTPTAPKAGIFGGKKQEKFEVDNAALRQVLSDLGVFERAALREEINQLRNELVSLKTERDSLRFEIVELRDEVMLQEIGIYRVKHALDDAPAYKERLVQAQQRMRAIEKEGRAFTSVAGWTLNGSVKEGQKLVTETGKLMLRAYNSEAENIVRTLKPHRCEACVERLNKAQDTIARLGKSMQIAISEEYHALRVYEIELTADFINRLAEEKDAQRVLREQQREEERAQAEMRREQQKLEKERAHRANVLAQLTANSGSSENIADAAARLAEIDRDIESLVQRAANTRAGYVYIISNQGAFGEAIVKIGMTRRLDPLDRINELGDASVPFRFDVHLLLFSDDAVALEAALHERFGSKRVNRVNLRREFFYVTPREVRIALEELNVTLLEFVEEAEAIEFRQSTALGSVTSAQ